MINEKNFLQLALHSYDNPQCVTVEEFKADFDRFSLIKKIITKYSSDGNELNERLILNHLVISFNVFGANSLLFLLYKIERKNWPILFPFLILLNQLPDYIKEHNLITSDISLNTDVIEKLRKL